MPWSPDVGAVDDDELVAMALAADVDAPLDPDAVPLSAVDDAGGDGLLPAWYMPAATAPVRGPLGRAVAVAFVVALVVVSGVGLCVTCGVAEIAW